MTSSGVLADRRHVFVTNIGGAGMSAVATLIAEQGHAVSGHDPATSTPFLDRLRALGVEIHTGAEHPALPDDVDAVVVSTATPDDAPEVASANQRGIPVLHRSIALSELCRARTTVAIAGTHGKSTTSAMLATILDGAGQEPGWVVGAPVPGLGRSAAWGGDGPLVVEADESDGTFLALPTSVAVVTNVEPDHLEHYGDFAALVGAFEQFLAGATGPRLVGSDDGLARDLGRSAGAVTVGAQKDADLQIVDLRTEGTGTAFGLARDGEPVCEVRVPLPGQHNARNAALALATAEALGVPLAEAAAQLASFAGVGRRFEVRGTAWGATLIDDYAHLPTEVAAALEAAKSVASRRVVCVFQPHRYSRTASLWRDFADAFGDADLLGITDVYSAGEAPRPEVTGKLVVNAVLDAHPWRHVAYLPRLDDVAAWLRAVLRPGDICLTLGAGDLTTLPDRLLKAAGS